MRRVRTKFTQNQKEKILEFAERVGWKLQKRDEELISEFCRAIGVEKRVFKVWLHNNNKMKKFATSDILLECLIQKILCLLSVKEAAKMSILSKAWLHAWSTLSTLKFTFDYHKGNMRMVDDIMERYKDGKIPIEKFELSNSFFDSEVCHLIDKWLDIVLQNDVKDLVFGAYSFPLYHMPIFKILAAISLRELVLNECDLMHHVSLSSGVMNCKSLRNLSLNEVNLDENMLQTLLNSCPLMIVTFNFKYCLGLENIELLNLRKIKSVSIRTHRRINQLVKIQAPTLEHLSYTGLSKELEVVECQSLKSLDLSYMTMPDGFLHSLISRFQSLEVLKIRDCKGITEIDTLELS